MGWPKFVARLGKESGSIIAINFTAAVVIKFAIRWIYVLYVLMAAEQSVDDAHFNSPALAPAPQSRFGTLYTTNVRVVLVASGIAVSNVDI